MLLNDRFPSTDPELATEIGKLLGIAVPPAGTAPGELAIWIAYWRPSYEAALAVAPEQISYLKAGGWWPPLTAEMVGTLAPEIVRKTLRPDL
jgi:hypothetical protein